MTTRGLQATLLLVCGLAAIGCDGAADDPTVPTRFRKFARAVEQERLSLDAPGIAVAVVEQGVVTFTHGFGQKDARRPDPVLPTTLFRIGSCTKMLTAVALLQTVQQGLVSLDEPIATHVPAFHLTKTPAAVAELKVRHLLTHSGGLWDYGETNAPADEQSDAALEQFATGRFADIDYVATPPGAVWAYANPDYMLAGLIAEKAQATPYRTLMHDRVLEPLGMQRTFFLPSEVLADGDYAVGDNCHDASQAGCFDSSVPAVVEPDSYDNPWGRPAGFAWSSVLDLAQVARFLVHGQPDVLDTELWSAMVSPQMPTKMIGDLVWYGFGVFVSEGIGGSLALPFRAIRTVSHGGDIAGFAADILCVPSLDQCIVALANSSGAHLQSSLAVGLETLAELPPATPPPDLAPRPERYPLYAGSYNDAFGVGQVSVTTSNGKLYIHIPSLDASGTPYDPELVPASVDNFAFTVSGQALPLTFIADATGTYTYGRSRPYVAIRTSGP